MGVHPLLGRGPTEGQETIGGGPQLFYVSAPGEVRNVQGSCPSTMLDTFLPTGFRRLNVQWPKVRKSVVNVVPPLTCGSAVVQGIRRLVITRLKKEEEGKG